MIDGRCKAVNDSPFLLLDAHRHGDEVILARFFPVGFVAFELHFSCLEIVARIVLIGYAYGADIELFDALEEVFGIDGKHLEHAGLSDIIAILGTSFALCQPDGFASLAQVVDILGEEFGIFDLLVKIAIAYDHESA